MQHDLGEAHAMIVMYFNDVHAPYLALFPSRELAEVIGEHKHGLQAPPGPSMPCCAASA